MYSDDDDDDDDEDDDDDDDYQKFRHIYKDPAHTKRRVSVSHTNQART